MGRERSPAELEKMEANRRRQIAAREAERWVPVRGMFSSAESRAADRPRSDLASCPRCGIVRHLGYEGDDPEDRQRGWEEFLKEHDRQHQADPASYLAGDPNKGER